MGVGTTLVGSFRAEDRQAVMVQFPGGYLAEIYAETT
jgi:hypothetical protein